MSKQEIIENVAKRKRVETLAQAVCKKPACELQDLTQMVYIVLLEYDEARIQDLWKKGQLDYFIMGIIRRQYQEPRQDYRWKFCRYAEKAVELTENYNNLPDEN